MKREYAYVYRIATTYLIYVQHQVETAARPLFQFLGSLAMRHSAESSW